MGEQVRFANRKRKRESVAFYRTRDYMIGPADELSAGSSASAVGRYLEPITMSKYVVDSRLSASNLSPEGASEEASSKRHRSNARDKDNQLDFI